MLFEQPANNSTQLMIVVSIPEYDVRFIRYKVLERSVLQEPWKSNFSREFHQTKSPFNTTYRKKWRNLCKLLHCVRCEFDANWPTYKMKIKTWMNNIIYNYITGNNHISIYIEILLKMYFQKHLRQHFKT